MFKNYAPPCFRTTLQFRAPWDHSCMDPQKTNLSAAGPLLVSSQLHRCSWNSATSSSTVSSSATIVPTSIGLLSFQKHEVEDCKLHTPHWAARALLRISRCRQVDGELPEFLFPSLALQRRAFTSLMHYLPSTAIGHVLVSASWFQLAGSKGRFEVFLPKSLHLRLSRTLESSSSSLQPPVAPLCRAGVHRNWSKPHANQGWVVTKYI